MASFNTYFHIHTSTCALISSAIWFCCVLHAVSVQLFHVLSAQLFLQAQRLPHSKSVLPTAHTSQRLHNLVAVVTMGKRLRFTQSETYFEGII